MAQKRNIPFPKEIVNHYINTLKKKIRGKGVFCLALLLKANPLNTAMLIWSLSLLTLPKSQIDYGGSHECVMKKLIKSLSLFSFGARQFVQLVVA